jgi:hypothetical protein
MQRDVLAEKTMADEAPPFLGFWSRVYSAVLAYLAVLIALLYAITVAFRY